MIFFNILACLLCVFHTSLGRIIDVEDIAEGSCPDGFTGLVAHPTYCQFYYLCDNGSPNLRECPSQLYFNSILEACDLPQNVPECVEGTRGTSVPPKTTIAIGTTNDLPETEGEIETEATIPDKPTTLTQGTTTSTQRPTTTTTEPPGNLQCPDISSIFMPYPGDCSRYYLCEHGNVVSVRSCLDGLWFRYSLQVCMTPWGSDCRDLL